MQATKTFKIGEYAIGGKINVKIAGKVILISAHDWTTNKVVSSGSTQIDQSNSRSQIDNYLNELTSSYYAEKILNWIISKVNLL